MAVNGYKNREQTQNAVSVTGMASGDFVRDLVAWIGNIQAKHFDLETGGDFEGGRNIRRCKAAILFQ